jgi:NTE family protein
MKKKVQLVLGSGGARGIAHIGVIQMLEQQGYEIVEVYGCSMGAVIGGMYCAGYLKPYTEWLTKLTKSDVYRLFDVTFSMQGFVKGEKIFSVLEQMAGKKMIEDLPIPFVAVATDMLSRKEVHFSKGDLYKALRASTGIPGVFKPIAENQSLYVDGGVLNPLPVNLVKRRDDAIIVAVDLNGPRVIAPQTVVTPAGVVAEVETEASDMLSKMKKYFFAETISKAKAEAAAATPSFSMFEILDASYDATLDRLVDIMVQIYPPDILVKIPRNSAAVFEFYRAAELMEIGKKAYTKASEMADYSADESISKLS